MRIEKIVKLTRVYRQIKDATEKTVINKGGAGSSKTHSLLQFMLYERLYKKKDFAWQGVVLRKTRTANKLSIYKKFWELLIESGLYDEKYHNKSDLCFTNPNDGSKIYFMGTEDRERLKSTEWHDIVMEEASEFELQDYTFLKATRLFRGELKGDFKPRVWINYNPISCWIQGIENKEGVTLIRSTYKDNPFANEETKKELENLKYEDIAYYKIYALGEDAEYSNIIYKPYIVLPEFPADFDEVIYGLDFGFNNPSALIEIGIKDKKRYLEELIYQTKMTNGELIELMKEKIPEHRRSMTIYADNAEPNRIQEINNAGFNCLPADKAVKDGLDFCKRQTYYTLEKNVNLNNERKTYKYKVNKDGTNQDEPVKFRDHCVSGDTLIDTKCGQVKIKDLIGKTGFVYCYNKSEKKMSVERFKDVRLTKKQARIYKIIVKDGRIIKATEDHLVLTNGGWKKVKELKVNDTIIDIKEEINAKS